jgi:threonine dehydratase
MVAGRGVNAAYTPPLTSLCSNTKYMQTVYYYVKMLSQIMLDAGLVVDPSDAVAAAAGLYHHYELPAVHKVVAFISGENIDPIIFTDM